MTTVTRTTRTPGTLEIWTQGRCLVATPATDDGPTFTAVLDDDAAAALMADPSFAAHFSAERLPDADPVTAAPAKKAGARAAAEHPAQA